MTELIYQFGTVTEAVHRAIGSYNDGQPSSQFLGAPMKGGDWGQNQRRSVYCSMRSPCEPIFPAESHSSRPHRVYKVVRMFLSGTSVPKVAIAVLAPVIEVGFEVRFREGST